MKILKYFINFLCILCKRKIYRKWKNRIFVRNYLSFFSELIELYNRLSSFVIVSWQMTPLTSMKLAIDFVMVASRIPLESLTLSDSVYLSSYFFMSELACHVRFVCPSSCTATAKIPFSTNVVYSVSTPMRMK